MTERDEIEIRERNCEMIETAINQFPFKTTTSEGQKKVLLDIAITPFGEYSKTNCEIGRLISRKIADTKVLLRKLEQRKLIQRRHYEDENGTVERRVLTLHPDFAYALYEACRKGDTHEEAH